ncbi:MAG: 4Fe-4S cluster-binding domain-containing protein [Candidatus Aegiribacteria sp.]|nr:4Fe-4S cluster-binding domain-containing protein [Candidatus Aegiribacteria sp.]
MVSSLYLMPTSKCNCVCEYCYCPENGVRGDSSLFMRIAESFTTHACNSGFPARSQIRFTGGEPWLEKKLLPAIADLFFRRVTDGWVVVNTNATILPKEILRDFSRNKRLIHVVSLDGTESIHDSRRKTSDGRGSFHQVVTGIKILMDLNLPVYLNAVFDTGSSNHLPELLRFISSEFGLGELSISLRYTDTDPMSPEEQYDLLKNAYSAASSHSIRLGGHHRLLLGFLIPELRCNAGSSTALIDPQGMVYACQRFVGRVKPDCMWTEDFDWSGFSSGQQCGPICGDNADNYIGKKLFELYRKEYPEYLHCNQLDRTLFGVLS